MNALRSAVHVALLTPMLWQSAGCATQPQRHDAEAQATADDKPAPTLSEGWWVGFVAGAVLGAFVVDAVLVVLGSGAVSLGHRQCAVRAWWWTVGQGQRLGGNPELGEEAGPGRWCGVGAPAW